MNVSYVFLANGFEEIEALTVVDVMRRAGMEVKTVSINEDCNVTGAHGIKVIADTALGNEKITSAEWLIAPGGMPGSINLHNCEELGKLLKEQADKGGKVAAICAAPAFVLAPLGILDGKEATCYPGCENGFTDKVLRKDAPVVKDGNIITANGPASASLFALAIVAASLGEGLAQEIGAAMLHYHQPINIYL
ncbi:MAG: DJ-1 family glyoxalase III [Muribaculaceae bacterium]